MIIRKPSRISNLRTFYSRVYKIFKTKNINSFFIFTALISCNCQFSSTFMLDHYLN